MKKVISLLVIILSLLLCLVSCKISGTQNNGQTDDSSSDGKLWGEGIVTGIIAEEGDGDVEYTELLTSAIQSLEGYGGKISARDSLGEELDSAIIIGESGEKITAEAKKRLERTLRDINEDVESPVGFIVYFENNILTLLWSDGRIKCEAIRFLNDNYLSKNDLTLEDGYSHTEAFSYIEYLAEKDAAVYTAEWAKVEEKLGHEVTVALQTAYAAFDERIYIWMADLYDPAVGGFYYSNSARNNYGYLPDLESTAQVLNFLDDSGLTKSVGGWEYALSDKTLAELVAFAKGLQSPSDGYFYHPQWEGLSYTTSRLGRDMGWATSILNTLYEKKFNAYYEVYFAKLSTDGLSGKALESAAREKVISLHGEELKNYMPLYTTPEGTQGSLGAPGITVSKVTKHLPTGLYNSSIIKAVSQIITASEPQFSEHLKSLGSWIAYLRGGESGGIKYAGFNLSNDSYSAGNTISSQTDQIIAREMASLKSGENGGYIEATVSWLNENAKADNGLWEADVTYSSVNGLMKIGMIYNALSAKIPYPEESFNSALDMIKTENADSNGKVASAAVDIYNPWVVIANILENLENNSNKDADRKALREKIYSTVLSEAPFLIQTTMKKLSNFAKDDGSYGYSRGASPSRSQGMPVSVDGQIEGDVNGCCLAFGAIENICKAIGIKDDMPSLFRTRDLERFLTHLNGLGNVIKDEEQDTPVTVFTFEDDPIASSPTDMTADFITQGRLEVAQHNSPTVNNRNMLIFEDSSTQTGADNYFGFIAQGAAPSAATSAYLEFDIYLEDISAMTYMQIFITDSYLMKLVGASDGSATLGDSSSTSGNEAKYNEYGVRLLPDRWYRIRIHHFYSDRNSTRTKVYVDGELRYISTNYIGNYKLSPVEPTSNAKKASISSNWSSTALVYFDNMSLVRTKDRFTEEEIAPDPATAIKHFDFEEYAIGATTILASISAFNSSSSIRVENDPFSKGNKALLIHSVAKNSANSIEFNNNSHAGEDVHSAEFDILLTDYTSGLLQIYMYNSANEAFASLNVNLTSQGALTFKARKTSNMGQDVGLGAISAKDWVRIKIEYYTAEDVLRLYANGTALGETAANYNGRSDADLKAVGFYTLRDGEYDIYIDNLSLKSSVGEYAPITPDVPTPDEPDIPAEPGEPEEPTHGTELVPPSTNDLIPDGAPSADDTAGEWISPSKAYGSIISKVE